jgi:hypothetical protein
MSLHEIGHLPERSGDLAPEGFCYDCRGHQVDLSPRKPAPGRSEAERFSGDARSAICPTQNQRRLPGWQWIALNALIRICFRTASFEAAFRTGPSRS